MDRRRSFQAGDGASVSFQRSVLNRTKKSTKASDEFVKLFDGVRRSCDSPPEHHRRLHGGRPPHFVFTERY
jgi:hypothetical protein